jgi:hypothetical protein
MRSSLSWRNWSVSKSPASAAVMISSMVSMIVSKLIERSRFRFAAGGGDDSSGGDGFAHGGCGV